MEDPLVNLVSVVGFLIFCISTIPTILYLGARATQRQIERERGRNE